MYQFKIASTGRRKKIVYLLSVIFAIATAGVILSNIRNFLADETVPPLNTNILQNGTFENGLSSWSPGANGTGSTATTELGYEGQSLKLQSGLDTTWQAATQTIPLNSIVPGYYYELSAKSKTTQDHNAVIGIYIDDSSMLSISKTNTGNNEWQDLSTRFYLPLTDRSGASTLNRVFRVNLYGINSGTNHDPVYYDNVMLTRLDPPASSTEWSISPGNDSFHPTTSNSYLLNITAPTPNAEWYNVHDGSSDHWTSKLSGENTFSVPIGVNSGSALLTLSAWTDKPENGGVLIKQYAESLKIFYDYSIKTVKFSIQATDKGDGTILLKAVPPEGTPQALLDQIQYYTWDYNQPVTQNQTTTWEHKFTNNTGATPELLVSFNKPGVQYMKVYAQVASELNPKSSVSSQSTAFLVGMPPENGDPLSIVEGWSSDHIISTHPIPGNQRFSLTKESITLFSDGNLSLPLESRDGEAGLNPDKIEIDLPSGISLIRNSSSYYNISDISGTAGSTLETGYHRYQLNKTGSIWSWENRVLLLFPHFESDSVIGQPNQYMKVRAFNNADASRTDNWQSFKVSCEAIPEVRLPERLTTSYTWTNPNSFSLNTGNYPDNTNFISLYKKLGFNTVPLTRLDLLSQSSPQLTTRAQRQTEAWQGLKFGPEYSPLIGGSWGLGYFNAINLDQYNSKYGLSLNESDIDAHVENIDFNSAFGFNLTSEQIILEKNKWKNALHFFAANKTVDIAYDGVFLARDLADLATKINLTKPEYIFLDIEGFGNYKTWRDNISESLNAQAKKQELESGIDLADRMCDQFLAALNQAVTSASSTTKMAYYDAHAENDIGYQYFPWSLLEKNNFIAQPSVYIAGRNIDGYSQLIRNNRANLSRQSELIPWLTNGAYGEINSDQIFDQVIHTFLNGANGFSFFYSDYTDDMADTLNITKAIGLVSPYENIIMDGELALNDVANISNASISAMKLNEDYLLAITPKNKNLPVSFDLNTGTNKNYTLADLRHGTTTSSIGSSINYSGLLSESTVFRIMGTAITPNLNLTINPTSSFTYKDRIQLSGTKSSNIVALMINQISVSTNDNTETWTHDFALNIGTNNILVEGADQSNNKTSATASIIRRKPADANSDGIISARDFSSLMLNWNKQGSANPSDFNEDSKVNILDFSILMLNWGR